LFLPEIGVKQSTQTFFSILQSTTHVNILVKRREERKYIKTDTKEQKKREGMLTTWRSA
jgi:hypothetical protein